VPPAVGEQPGQLGRERDRVPVAHRLVRRHLVATVAGVGDDGVRLLDEDALHRVPVGGGRDPRRKDRGGPFGWVKLPMRIVVMMWVILPKRRPIAPSRLAITSRRRRRSENDDS